MTLGFDGSSGDDHTALVGCVVDLDHMFLVKAWKPLEGIGIDRADVDLTVRDAFARFDPVGFYADVREWESYIDTWSQELSERLVLQAGTRTAVGWDMRTREREFTRACERTLAALLASGEQAAKGVEPERRTTHDGSPELRWYVLNARRNPNKYGISVRKEHRMSARKIDAVPAMVLARLARQDYLALPPEKRRRSGSRKVW